KAKRALVDAAHRPHAAIERNYTRQFDNSDDVRRVKALESAQKPVAKAMPGIDAFIDVLKTGEADLAKLTSPAERRWRAAFELAYGRAAAAKVRHEGFIQMTAVMKGGRKFEDEKHQYWVLEPTDEPMKISALD